VASPSQLASLASAAALLLGLLAPSAFGDGPPEVVIRAAPQGVPALTAEEKQRVQQAIDRGIAYLRRTQLPTGSWVVSNDALSGHLPPSFDGAGFAGLGGLALLESGVAPDDPAVQSAARFIWQTGARLHRTYDLTLALLFLERLGDPRPRALLRSLGLRLAAGQTPLGAWGYDCPLLDAAQEKRLEETLSKKTRADVPPQFQPPPPRARGRARESADNSNSQFAVLALAAARRHGMPLDFTLGLTEQRFRLSENAKGWDYRLDPGIPNGYGSMTCVGLLALAVGRAAAEDKADREAKKGPARAEDPGIAWGLKVLGAYMRYPSDRGLGATLGPQVNGKATSAPVNLYFLWSVERVGVLCGVQTIGGTDWYRWGAQALVPTQRPDGSWIGGGSLGYPAADTSFALLFLRRSDLLPDLRWELAKRVRIVDPGPFVKAGPTKKGAPDPKDAGPEAGTPDFKGLVGAKTAAEEDGPLAVDLGEVQAGKPVQLPLRVRGPAAFRITGVIAGDERVKVQADSRTIPAHDLTVTLRLDKAGTFERTLYLETDLPGRAEVAVRVRARATAAPGSPR
jgi:hypothetical protein